MSKGYTYDLKREGAASWNVARYIHGKKNEKSSHFEVAIDPDAAAGFREGKIASVREVLLSEDIFTDTKKGIRPSEQELIDAFGTADKAKVAEIIVKKGLIQYSDRYREEQKEKKKQRIMELVRVNCIDSKTGLPLPIQRIENAFAEAKVQIKDGKSAEDQFQDVVKELRAILPIRMDTKEFELSIPMKFASRLQASIKQFGSVSQENWKADGSYSCRIEVPAGIASEFFDKVNALTHGEAQIK